jgi:hypothetical protein
VLEIALERMPDPVVEALPVVAAATQPAVVDVVKH